MSSLQTAPDRETIVREMLEFIKTKYQLSNKELTQFISEEKQPRIEKEIEAPPVTVPVTIFNDTTSPLESIVKYLKEIKGMKLVNIAKLTGRDQRAIGVTYHAAAKKMPKQYKITQTKYTLPIAILTDKKLSVAEHIVKHLKENYNLTYHDVATLIKRDDRTVWTLYNRASKKTIQ